MAKRSAKNKKKSPTKSKRGSPVKKTRSPSAATKIKRLDAELVKLLQQRAELLIDAAGGNGHVASAAGVLNGDEQRFRSLADKSRGPMSAGSVRAVLNEVAGGCRSLIHAPRVTVPGQKYGFGHLAALRHFGRVAECLSVETPAAAIEEVGREQADFGLIPLQNTTDGRVIDAFENVLQGGLKLCGQVSLTIHYSLQGKCTRSDVREVYGEPAALTQCRGWLSGHLPIARLIEVANTTTACHLAAEKPGAAVAAVREAGMYFGLDLLAKNIENPRASAVRFAVVGRELSPRTKNDRTALLVQLADRPGALAAVLGVLKREKINLAWIESLQNSIQNGDGLFFLEIEGHQSDKRLCRKVAALEKKTLRIEFLGSYPVPATEP